MTPKAPDARDQFAKIVCGAVLAHVDWGNFELGEFDLLKLHGVFLHVVERVIASNSMDQPDQGESQASLCFRRVCSNAAEAGNERSSEQRTGRSGRLVSCREQKNLSQFL